MSDAVEPLRIEVPDEVLADLADRLARTRWPEAEPVDDWSQGMPLAYLRDLVEHWRHRYDWRDREARLGAWPHVRTTVDGLDLHALHARSPEASALPLVLTHGWPGAVTEFLEVLGPLTDPAAHGADPADAFHVVCPSLPGFGWSGKPAATGWGVERTADAWAGLMGRLGYDRFGAQGGDWGSAVSTQLGARHPGRVVGVHLNMVVALPGPDDGEPTEDEQRALDRLRRYVAEESGYSTEQRTRPQTIGYSLVDSPVGLCAWIVEKFAAWTDSGWDPVAALGADRLLDVVMTYWVTATGASAARLYWESFGSRRSDLVEVPTGVAVFPNDLFTPSRRWAARQYRDIRRWSVMERGGHFAAMEEPELFVEEVRAFFRPLR